MTRCARCRREVRVPTYVAGMAMGPRCAQAVAGAKPRRTRSEKPAPVDERQADLFAEATC